MCGLRSFSVACLLVAIAPLATLAQPPAAAEPDSALGVRQQRVARLMQDVERSFLALAKSLEATEPEKAARLVKAFEESKSLLVEQRMREIVKMLDGTKLDVAGTEQKQVVTDVRRLLNILMSDDPEREERRAEIEQLKAWHQQLSLLIKEEQRQERETQKLDKQAATQQKIDQQIEAVKELIRRQESLTRQTATTRAESISTLAELAGPQQTLRNDTEFVAKDIAEPAGEPKPNETADSSIAPQPGQKPLEDAAKRQTEAETHLAALRGKSAQQQEEQAVAELKKALAELEKERDRLKKPPAEELQKIAEQQDVTAQKTQSLSDQVSQSQAAAKPASAGACSACKNCLGGACQSMASAAQSLKKNSPNSAQKQQQQAQEELKKAQAELEKRLEELGEKMRDETIVRLEDIFRDMLARQQAATTETARLDVERNAQDGGELRRGDRVTLRRLSEEENSLADRAGEALRLIEEDGSSISFPIVVADLRGNLAHIAGLLDRQATGKETQRRQQEAEQTLAELLEALEVAKKNGGGEGKPGNGQCKPCLLPNTAELKLLRALQVRVNRQTKAFDDQRPAGELVDLQRSEVARMTQLQRDLVQMTGQILVRTKAAPAEPGLE
ncbi:MAG TPA: hypothetical protein VM165_21180 [Planctomycetaceae bacterium]|nr:hypothetical protein [Planctomycetaceae bacterium]